MKHFVSTIIKVLVLIIFLSIYVIGPSHAKDLNILMFLWCGETRAEKGFKEAIHEEFPDQNIEYTILDVFRNTSRIKEFIESINETDYQLIYTYGSTITPKVVKSFKSTPILFNIVFDPIFYNIIESWDVKQGNLTGVSISIPSKIILQKIHEIFGQGDIGLIYNPLNKNSVNMKNDMEAYLEDSGAELLSFEFREDFSALNIYLDSIKKKAKCIYLPTEYLIAGYIDRIFACINQFNLPTCITSKTYFNRGGLLCVSAEYYEMGKSAGKIGAQILKGTKPSDIPVKRPSEFDITLYVNSLLLKKMNIELPKDLDIKYIR